MIIPPLVSVILTTYNQPHWLDLVLHAYTLQQPANFEIVVADDGSDTPTRAIVERYQSIFGERLQHVWQADEGFQKSRIMNKAIVAARHPYLIFSDGDCLPQPGFVATHAQCAQPNRFLSGGYFKLSPSVSQSITKDDIDIGRVFDPAWLRAQGQPKTYKTLKLTAQGAKVSLLNALTPARASWNGHNSSGWKVDIERVNGFDERMQYGGQDRELGERLVNAGVRGVQIRYTTTVVHLEHARPYRTAQSLGKNAEIRATTRKNRLVWTDHGITQ